MDIQTIMAATVHDVKNSLGLIDGQLHDLVRKLQAIDPDSAQEMRRIQLECGRINNGMVHMLGLYKLQIGNFNTHIDEVLVKDVIDDVVSRYRELVTPMGINLQVDMLDEDCLWFLDANLIEGLLGNVLTNSIRYTRSTLLFEIEQKQDWLNIRIRDDGNGFPAAMLTLLEQPDSIDFQSGATGLGLYFCQQIAEAHQNEGRQGYIKLSNDAKTGGAIFDLWLP